MNKPFFCFLLLLISPAVVSAEQPKQYNLLFLMTDQHRYDVMGSSGNPVVKTPNLDELAANGVRFSSAFTVCPVCTPSRTSMFVGRSIGNTGISTNGQSTQNTPSLLQMKSYDKILNENGFYSEYHGKWHSPLCLAGLHKPEDKSYFHNFYYSILPDGKYANGENEKHFDLIQKNAPFDVSELKDGLQIQRRFLRPYAPVSVDMKYGFPSPKSALRKDRPENLPADASDFGKLLLDVKYSLTSFQRDLVLQALDDAKKAGKPFNITASIIHPHPPMVITEPYYSKYRDSSGRPIKELNALIEPSIGDRSPNSPYHLTTPRKNFAGHYNDPEKITEMMSVYYGLVTEVDDAVGQIIQKLKDIGEYENTLIIYTSDHGEMLGSHGLNGKGNFYDAAVRIPLLVKLPKGEHKGEVVDKPVMSTDFFATILDYTISDTKTPSDGKSLRTVIENPDGNWRDFAVIEWNHTAANVPSYCVTTKDWKLMLARSDKAKNGLYDLKNDPNELVNLLYDIPAKEREKYRNVFNDMKKKLLEYLTEINHPDINNIRLAGDEAARLLSSTPKAE